MIKPAKTIIVIAHNIRSTYNVGSIFRTCDGFGVERLYLTGYTPYPTTSNDTRLAHQRDKLTRQLHKTALGAEKTVDFAQAADVAPIIQFYKQQGYTIIALEQTGRSVMLPEFRSPARTVLLLGEEVDGIRPELLALCDVALEIPMRGHKESFNVSVATGIALYALTTD